MPRRASFTAKLTASVAVDRGGVTETRICEHLWRAHAQHPRAGLDDLANLFNDAGEHLSSSHHTVPPRPITP